MSDRLLERDTLRLIMADAEKALAEVAAKHGMEKLHPGRVTFDPNSGSFHFKVEGVVGGGLSAEERAYETERRFDKELPPLGTEFKDEGNRVHKIKGANKNGKVLTTSGGKSFVWRDRNAVKLAYSRSN